MKALIALALLVALPGANAEPCAEDGNTRVTGASKCLLMRQFGPADAKNLLIWLHGDVSSGGAANYHFPVAKRATETLAALSVQSVALVRPGYPDGSGDSSSVDPSQDGRSDHYTREKVAEVASAIRHLKQRYPSGRVTMIGHSGGAATAAVILGMEPDLVDAAVLVSCPSDLTAWRINRKPWKRSENPIDWTEKVSPTTRVVALTGARDDNTASDLAKRYVEALRARGISARFAEIGGATHNEALRAEEVAAAIAELLQAPESK